MSFDVEHLPEQGRFQVVVDGQRCVCDYRLVGSVMNMVHTEVAPQLEGRGIAAAVVRAALAHAEAAGLKVNPLCSYVRSYMRRHPETQGLLADARA
jgi:predicted GNAT family acetyltransferase